MLCREFNMLLYFLYKIDFYINILLALQIQPYKRRTMINTDMNSPAYQREKKQTFLICIVVIVVIILLLVFL